MGLFRSTIADARAKTYSAVQAAPVQFTKGRSLSAFTDSAPADVDAMKDSTTDVATVANKAANHSQVAQAKIVRQNSAETATGSELTAAVLDSDAKRSKLMQTEQVSVEGNVKAPKKISSKASLSFNSEKLNPSDIKIPERKQPHAQVTTSTTSVQSATQIRIDKPVDSFGANPKEQTKINNPIKPIELNTTSRAKPDAVQEVPRPEPLIDNNRFIKHAHSKATETTFAEVFTESSKTVTSTPLVDEVTGKTPAQVSQSYQALIKPSAITESRNEQAKPTTKNDESEPFKSQASAPEPVFAQEDNLATAANVESAQETNPAGTAGESESSLTAESALPSAVEVDTEPAFALSDFLSPPQNAHTHDVRIGQIDVFIEGGSATSSKPASSRAARPSIAFASRYMVRGL